MRQEAEDGRGNGSDSRDAKVRRQSTACMEGWGSARPDWERD